MVKKNAFFVGPAMWSGMASKGTNNCINARIADVSL